MKKIFIAAIGLVAVAAIFLLLRDKNKEPVSIPIKQNISTDFAYNQQQFISGLSAGQEKVNNNFSPIKLIVVPHHQVASSLISQGLFQLQNKNQPQNLIILSPNHNDTGQCPVITTLNSWDTVYGTVETNQNITRSFLEANSVCFDNENISSEHGLAGIMPYVKYIFPETKVVSLSFKKNISRILLDQISTEISKIQGALVIASIDFSHGLPASETYQKDASTLALIKNGDLSGIENLSSQYLDSPSVLITTLKLKQILNLQVSPINYSNATQITEKFTEDTTSYMVLGFHSEVKNTNEWSFVAGGDVMLGRTVNTQSIKYQDFTWAFKNIYQLFKSADISFVNLESPLTIGCQPTDSGMIFCGSQDHLQGLEYTGIDIVNLANNHINNYGQKGIDETISLLRTKNILTAGLGNIAVKDVGGVKVALVGFDALGNLSNSEVQKTVSETKKLYPLVIVSFHWGAEYQKNPNNRQIELAHLAIDSGADIIIGHHPHWVQSEEIYKEKPIFYSLGNLIFDQMWSEETKKGMIIKLNFTGNKLISTDHFPIYIHDYGQPKLATQSPTP